MVKVRKAHFRHQGFHLPCTRNYSPGWHNKRNFHVLLWRVCQLAL